MDYLIDRLGHLRSICFQISFAGGQEGAKRALEEAVILPVLRPEVNYSIKQ